MKNKIYMVGLCAAVAFAFGCKKKDENKDGKKPAAPKTTAPKVKVPPKAAAAPKIGSQKGKVQLTFVFTAKPDQVAEGDKLFASHAAWMATSHQKDGKLALLRYDVVKGGVLSEALNPASKPTKDTHFVLVEVYETADGIGDHWKKASAEDGWKDFKAFVAWASKTTITDLHGGEVIQSLWDKPSPNHKGKTQLTMVFTAKAELVAEGEKLFASHAAWMAKSHHKDGELALHRYNVAKGAVKEKSLDPSSKDTTDVNFVLTEVYEGPEGIADHWKQATAKEGGWADFQAFMTWAKKTKVTAMHGAPVAHSLW